MISKAIQRHIRISPRKMGLVVDAIRHQKVDYAIAQLENMDKKAADLCLKLLRSAVANATNNNRMNASKLYVLSAVANEGPTLKRVLPRAKGSADTIRKRTCHVEIIISDDEKDLAMQRESYKKNNKYNDLIHGKLNKENVQVRNSRKSLLLEEAKKKQDSKNGTYEPEEVAIYTKEEFEKVKISEPEKKNKKAKANKEAENTKALENKEEPVKEEEKVVVKKEGNE